MIQKYSYIDCDLFRIRFYDKSGAMYDFLTDYATSVIFDSVERDIIISFLENGIAFIGNKYGLLAGKKIQDYENKLNNRLKEIGSIEIEILTLEDKVTERFIFYQNLSVIRLNNYKYYFHSNCFKRIENVNTSE